MIDLAKRFDLCKELRLQKTSRIVLVEAGGETIDLNRVLAKQEYDELKDLKPAVETIGSV